MHFIKVGAKVSVFAETCKQSDNYFALCASARMFYYGAHEMSDEPVFRT